MPSPGTRTIYVSDITVGETLCRSALEGYGEWVIERLAAGAWLFGATRHDAAGAATTKTRFLQARYSHQGSQVAHDALDAFGPGIWHLREGISTVQSRINWRLCNTRALRTEAEVFARVAIEHLKEQQATGALRVTLKLDEIAQAITFA